MAEVFISYSSVDSVKAKDIVDRIEGAGITCWISQRDIPPGADYAIEIPKAISACSYFVLLLTNAAQESPYVMLELDQAFKQKKEIIPILLEQVVENEKTNFFLNAKQKLDATKSITAAVNNVLRRIRPNITENPVSESSNLNKDISRRKALRCPHCGCTVIKQKRYFLDRYLYPKEGNIKNNAVDTWIIRNRVSIEGWILCYAAIASLALILILLAGSKKTVIEIITLGVILAAHALLGAAASKASDIPDLLGQLINVISSSKLKYWTFRCAGCEKNFSILLPRDAQLKDLAPDLVENNSQEE